MHIAEVGLGKLEVLFLGLVAEEWCEASEAGEGTVFEVF